LRARFAIQPGAEFTSEANPGTLTPAWLDAFLAAGGNRLSVGVQAKQERLLRVLGRIHTFDQALSALEAAKRAGVGNLNADAMFGLPEQTLSDYLDTLSALADASVTHVSAYSADPGGGHAAVRKRPRRGPYPARRGRDGRHDGSGRGQAGSAWLQAL
jgi:oxygen-independent coproporphyrinogen-3 oxidase